MSSTGARFGLKIPDGTDPFDNDLYLKGNLNILEAQAAKTIETVAASGQKIETIEITFTTTGTTDTITGTGTFAKLYASAPYVMPAQVVTPVSYADRIMYPYIFNVTTAGCSVTLKTSYTGSALPNFAAGTFKMRFVVFGA